ncbi:AMP-binding enzyme [Hirsutella rhossiliensis]
MSTRLAHHLVHLGLRPGAIVPLCFEKSIWTGVAIMGVMKAGAASVAMDVGQPVQRLRQIVNKVDPRLVLCSANATDLAVGLIETSSSRQALSVSADLLITLSSIPLASPSQLPSIDPSSPLYVVFTSGSTGVPKGAVISHENFCSAIYYQREAMRYGPGSRVFDFVSYSFDVTWPNILQTLTAGGCVCVPSEDERKNDISAAIRRLGATAIHVPPSVARLIDPAEAPAIELVVLGGEPVALSDVTRWGTGVEVVQVYGPAECTPPVMVSYNVSSGDSMKNIGRGCGVVPWIVDVSDCQKLAPIGVMGELVLEGPLVGLGYLGEPEKTAVAFLQDPVWLVRGCPGRPGRPGRVYRTGDLAKYDADGSIMFIGRKDAQVKVHGQRIELGEVEVHVEKILQGQPCQIDVMVDAVTPKNSTTAMLVAFMVVGSGASSLDDRGGSHTAASLRDISMLLKQGLLEMLPVYMVPTAYIPIEKMPVTGTGKKDRRRLREIGASMTLEELTSYNPDRQEKRQPETKWERRLLLMASKILGTRTDSIGADDSFIQIGGDSIAAMRLVALARNQYRATLTVNEIFKHPRFSVLAQLVESRIASSTEDMAAMSGMIQPGSDILRI